MWQNKSLVFKLSALIPKLEELPQIFLSIKSHLGESKPTSLIQTRRLSDLDLLPANVTDTVKSSKKTHFLLNWRLNATEHGSDLNIRSEGRSVLRAVLIGPDRV